MTNTPRSTLRTGDILRVGSSGLLTRKARAVLSALGISIGIAALVGVLSLSESSSADLLAELDALGTNLLTVEAGSGIGAGDSSLPAHAADSVGRVPTVDAVSAVSAVDADVYRNEFIPDGETGGISVLAADKALLETLNGEVVDGVFLDEAPADYPVAVVGSVAADRLGIEGADGHMILIGGDLVEVVGVLAEFPLAPDLDRTVLVAEDAARTWLVDEDIVPSTIYVRVDTGAIDATRDVLAATADPENPEEVEVSRPSDVLEAQIAAERAFDALFLGLGAVALLVGGVGIANVMVIAVIERRNEIGLRRALGATEGHIRIQFLTEALILSFLGGVAGVAIGAAVTAGYAWTQGWMVVIPLSSVFGGLGAALAIGAIAGLYPAMRAARLAPTEALRATA